MAENTMIYWLAQAAKQLREEAERKQVHIAATMSIDQSSIYRFEQGETWPRQADLVVAAYAEDLEIADARDIWERALKLWREQGAAPTVSDLMGARGRPADAAKRVEQQIADAAQASDRSSARSSRTSSAKANRRRAS